MPRGVYEAREQQFAREQRALASRSRRTSHVRLALFVLLIGLAVWAGEGGGVVGWLLGGVVALFFIGFVIRHGHIRRAEQRAGALRSLALGGLARLDRAWDRLPVWARPPDLAAHPYADDLDLFGRGALTQLMGEPGSPSGRERLTAWLLELPAPEETRARQSAVRELAGRIDYRDELALRARPLQSVSSEDVASFVKWCEEEDHGRAGWLQVASLAVPLALWVSATLRLAGIWTADIWIVPALAAVALTFGPPGSRARQTFVRAFRREPLFRDVPGLLGYIAEADYAAPRLLRAREALRRSGDSPRHELERLSAIAHLSDLRRSILHAPIQLLTLWDLHVQRRLHHWRARNGTHVRGWLDAAADAEALSALATLAHDQPGWCYPAVRPEMDRIEAAGLGHPMLPSSTCVANDVTVGPAGSFLLVTGSNMSGKSTLLRTIGVNLVLARIGAPACAYALCVPVAIPCVSMRVQDSLSRGVSFFMAELQRMRAIVGWAQAAANEGWTCVFLLDEMLHGTNSAERRIAARLIIEQLVHVRAIGAVSTHDLQLGAEPSIRDLAVRVHFSETVVRDNGRPSMSFDYKLRAGDATSTNALVLLELMGLTPPAGGPATGT